MLSVYEQHAKIFKAFCDENRLRILELLQDGDLCACVLIEKLGIKQPALSYHMKILVESGIVESTPVGKWTHYHISENGCEYAQMLLYNLTAMHVKTAEVCVCASS
ncbi:MAG: metalloregulator ArsR/SmtB family transcription factor [Eubacteriales bacterium]|nr:metalloregulator ArsR/SmtB family transcription factor [Eubacteriales bacterium]